MHLIFIIIKLLINNYIYNMYNYYPVVRTLQQTTISISNIIRVFLGDGRRSNRSVCKVSDRKKSPWSITTAIPETFVHILKHFSYLKFFYNFIILFFKNIWQYQYYVIVSKITETPALLLKMLTKFKQLKKKCFWQLSQYIKPNTRLSIDYIE